MLLRIHEDDHLSADKILRGIREADDLTVIRRIEEGHPAVRCLTDQASHRFVIVEKLASDERYVNNFEQKEAHPFRKMVSC